MAKQVYCQACGYTGPARGYGCVQIFILIFLLCLGILPGILYAIYADSLAKACPKCDQKRLIPADSPMAQKP
jgi:hypothetical protein